VLAVLNLGVSEIVLILVVAILVFGRDLPSAAVRAASTLQGLRRSLADLRRDTGIDEELRRARREIEQALPRAIEPINPRTLERKLGGLIEDPGPAAPPAHERGAGEKHSPS